MRTSPLPPALILALPVGLGPACAWAQPESDPQLTDPSWRDVGPGPVVDPLESGAADGGESALRVRPAPLLPEGAFLAKRRGTMVKSGSGEWVFVFYPDAEGNAEPPMTLLPSAALERMEEVTLRREVRPEFILTGQVFAYERTNYLLPTAFSVATPPPAPGSEAPEQDPAPPEGGAEAAPASPLDQAVEALVKRIEAERPGERALGDTSVLAEAVDPGRAGPAGVEARPDGELLVRRRARLIRMAGAWRLAIDNDPDGPHRSATMMVVLPCLNLERMERLAAERGENQTFEVSGIVTQYRRANYIVPTIYRLTRPGDVAPLQ